MEKFNSCYLVNILTIFALLFFVSCTNEQNKNDVKVEQNNKKEASVTSKMRVVSQLPNVTEIMYAAGIEELLVGVTDFCKYPEEAQRIASVGGIMNPDFELVLSLKPDLVIVQDTQKELDEKYRKLGFKTLIVKAHSINDIIESVVNIGKATENIEQTEKLAKKIKLQFDEIKQKAKDRKIPKTLLVIGHDQKSLREIWAAGGNTFYNEVLALAGGKNIFADSAADYPVISKEEILKNSPEVIIVLTGKEMTDAEIEKETRLWDVMSFVSAVKNKRVHVIPGQAAHIPGPRTPEIAKKIQQALFAGINE